MSTPPEISATATGSIPLRRDVRPQIAAAFLGKLRISNNPATHGPLDGTEHQIATADRTEDGALLTPTP